MTKFIGNETLPEVIKIILDEWIQTKDITTAMEINNGGCEDFAKEVMSYFNGDCELICTESVSENFFAGSADEPGHYWILYKDKHYDSECPDGVSDWMDLPIFLRYVECKHLI